MEKHYEIKKTINKIIREKKRFPSLQEMCNILHYTEDQTKKYMQVLAELNKIREEERILLKESKDKGIILGVTEDTEDIVNFYGWLAKVLGIDKDKAQFFMSLLPAVFTDILAPVGIAVSLFLRNKYK